jgi:hypothetical protein
VLATTARGQGIQLVTVWHDKSQLEARYGTKASTILNDHRAKLFLSGLADLSALELGSKLIGDRQVVEQSRSLGSDGRHSVNESSLYRPLLPVEDLRRLRPGRACCCMGTCARSRSGCGRSTTLGSGAGVSGWKTARSGTCVVGNAAASAPSRAPGSVPNRPSASGPRSRRLSSGSTPGWPVAACRPPRGWGRTMTAEHPHHHGSGRRGGAAGGPAAGVGAGGLHLAGA